MACLVCQYASTASAVAGTCLEPCSLFSAAALPWCPSNSTLTPEGNKAAAAECCAIAVRPIDDCVCRNLAVPPLAACRHKKERKERQGRKRRSRSSRSRSRSSSRSPSPPSAAKRVRQSQPGKEAVDLPPPARLQQAGSGAPDDAAAWEAAARLAAGRDGAGSLAAEDLAGYSPEQYDWDSFLDGIDDPAPAAQQ